MAAGAPATVQLLLQQSLLARAAEEEEEVVVAAVDGGVGASVAGEVVGAGRLAQASLTRVECAVLHWHLAKTTVRRGRREETEEEEEEEEAGVPVHFPWFNSGYMLMRESCSFPVFVLVFYVKVGLGS